MKHLIKTEKDWLKIRKNYVTASDSAVLLGLNPYSSVKKLRDSKTGASTFNGNANTKMGQYLESLVVLAANDITGLSFNRVENDKGHKEFYVEGNLGATPDAYNDKGMLLECKTTRPDLLVKYSSFPPVQYLCQVQTQMICTNMNIGYLAILGTNLTQKQEELIWPMVVYKIKKIDSFCAMLIEESKRFMEDENFKVNSSYKNKSKFLLSMCYEKIHH